MSGHSRRDQDGGRSQPAEDRFRDGEPMGRSLFYLTSNSRGKLMAIEIKDAAGSFEYGHREGTLRLAI